MKKTNLLKPTFILIILLLTSCNQTKKEIGTAATMEELG